MDEERAGDKSFAENLFVEECPVTVLAHTHTQTHSYLLTLPNLTQLGRVYTRTNPISPFEYHDGRLLICLFEACDESTVFQRTQHRPNIHTYLFMLRVELFLHTIGWMPAME